MSSDFEEKRQLARRIIACQSIYWCINVNLQHTVGLNFSGLSDSDVESIIEQVDGMLVGSVDDPSLENVEAAYEFLADLEKTVQELVTPTTTEGNGS